MNPRDTVVYRALDADGRLLYVGVTNDLQRRFREHRASSTWFALVHRIRQSGPFPRTTALQLERNAIETESPLFNITVPGRALLRRRHDVINGHFARLVDEGLDWPEALHRAVRLGDREVPCPDRGQPFPMAA